MKKANILIVILFIMYMTDNVYAQTPGLTIKLLDALSFSISQPEKIDLRSEKSNKNERIIASITDHITVISSRGYEVKATFGSDIKNESAIKLSPHIGTSNKGNTAGLVFGKNVALPASSSNWTTLISASKTSWNGVNPENKFNIEYIFEHSESSQKSNSPLNIPVIYTVLQP